MTDAQRLQQIENNVRATICPTYGAIDGVLTERIEGRISAADFEWMIDLVARLRGTEAEACAALFESVNPASDTERHNGDPGAGAMGAILEFRDLIRARAAS